MITIAPIRVSAIQSYNRQKTGKSQNKLSFKSNQLGVLEKEYISLIKNSKSNLVKSFLALSADSGSLKTLFNNILQNEETGFEFIKDAIKNPRENNEIAKRISDKIGNGSNIFFTFAYGTPYVKTYENYINKVYNEAKSFEELFKIRPDWSGESLLDKNLALNKQEFELGKIPYDLPKEDLFLIINYLKQFMQGSGAKNSVNIDNLEINGKNYNFEYFTDGKTDKNVFGILLPSSKKYILKMADEDKRSLDGPFALGTLAKIDMYMTQNKSRNSAPLLYYNHDKNFLIYEYIEHTPVSGDTKNLYEIEKHIPDYKALGLTFNDNVGSNNCFLLNEKSNPKLNFTYGFNDGIANGEWISVDNDHVIYHNLLNPQIRGMHLYLPNAMQYCV